MYYIAINILITYEDVYMLYQYNFCKGCYWHLIETGESKEDCLRRDKKIATVERSEQ